MRPDSRKPANRTRIHVRRAAALLICVSLLLASVPTARADALPDIPWQEDDPIVAAGDWLQIILPTIALGTTIVKRDWEGTWQFAKQAGINMGLTHTTKFISGQTRPDRSNQDSFPSGHTNAAFMGPSFVHFRYGWQYAIPMYAGAIFVGYSRVYANKHWTGDVFAGASIAMITAWIFTTPYNDKVMLAPMVRKDGYGVTLSLKW